MNAFAELVRLLLGSSAIAERKLESGSPLCILGVDVLLSSAGMQCSPSKDKVQKWRHVIRSALEQKKMTAGQASKLAGGLSWATQNMFSRFGRAMLRPIFAQQYSRQCAVSEPLRLALEWWLEIFDLEIRECKPWVQEQTEEVNVCCLAL